MSDTPDSLFRAISSESGDGIASGLLNRVKAAVNDRTFDLDAVDKNTHQTILTMAINRRLWPIVEVLINSGRVNLSYKGLSGHDTAGLLQIALDGPSISRVGQQLGRATEIRYVVAAKRERRRRNFCLQRIGHAEVSHAP